MQVLARRGGTYAAATAAHSIIPSFPPIRFDGVGRVAAPAASRDAVHVSEAELHAHIAMLTGELRDIDPRRKSG
jgi:hypothetical protein